MYLSLGDLIWLHCKLFQTSKKTSNKITWENRLKFSRFFKDYLENPRKSLKFKARMRAIFWAQGFSKLTLENPWNSRWGRGLGFQGKSRSIQGLRLLKFQGCFEDFPWKSSNFKARTRVTFSMILHSLVPILAPN